MANARSDDEQQHQAEDMIFGMIIGLVLGTLAYRSAYASVFDFRYIIFRSHHLPPEHNSHTIHMAAVMCMSDWNRSEL
jgi:hypothetical protein